MIESAYVPQMTYTSVRATVELIGRTVPMQEIDRAVHDAGRSYVIQVSGEGGIGKTRLVGEVLRRYATVDELLVARQPVDLYHASTHSVEGLMAAIQESVAPDGAGFEAYRKAQAELNRFRAERTSQRMRLHDLRDEVETAFLGDLNRLSSDRRLVLAFDTAEKLVYEITEVETRLGLPQARFSVWGWLRDVFLPGIRNAVVIIAGRPQADRLAADLRQIAGMTYAPVRLEGFTEAEALAYFDAVAAAAAARGDSGVAERIRVLPANVRRSLAAQTAGRPILLALAIDYLVIADRLPPDLNTLTPDELERELVRVFQETNRPADEAVRALAWARKGMDAELLARVADLRTADGRWAVAQAEQLLKQLKDLSFVKIRPSDRRVFLHDEMYDLLERHVLRPRQYPPSAERAYGAVFAYYERRIEQSREALAAAYQELGRTSQPEIVLDRITEAADRLQAALVEDLHYRLRADARRGFDFYYRYAEEAALGENESLDTQLRAELLDFLVSRDSTGIQPEVDGLAHATVNADAAVRWVKRRIAAEAYPDAAGLAALARKSGLIPPGDRLAEAELATWEALAQFYGGLLPAEQIEQALVSAIETLKQLPRTWRRDAALARAYNNLGYLHRVGGRSRGAIRAYRQAIPLWRAVNIPAEQANTLNNLAFARSEMGDFSGAHRQAEDALELRRESGARPQIGLSLITLAHIAIRDSLLITAQRAAEQALALASAVDDARGQGLALTALAEAKRRFGAEGPCRQDEAKRLLGEAVEYAQKARDFFAAVREPSRRVEALIELGCAYRDWMKLRRHGGETGEETVASLAVKGAQALQEAQRLAAEQHIVYRQVDALVNEAWLHYYLEVYYRWIVDRTDEDQVNRARQRTEDCLARAESLFPSSYLITMTAGVPPLDPQRVIVPLLAQMGKTQLLWGQMAFNEFEDHGDRGELRKAVRRYTLSMEYDRMTGGAQFRDKQRAQDRIYKRLKKLNPSEWQEVYEAVTDTESAYRLGKSEMRRLLEEDFGAQEDLKAVVY